MSVCRYVSSVVVLTMTMFVTGVTGAEPIIKTPAGLNPLVIPADNPPTPEKIELGKMLYFDPRLSSENSVSCASCHDPKKGWSNGDGVATGIRGLKGGRSAPTI